MSKGQKTMGKALLPREWPGTYYIGEEEIDNVNKVLLARSPFRYYGPDVQHYADQIEAAYCERVGRRYALGVNSGTAALGVALNALDIGPGDEVLLPGYFWVACVGAVVRAGAIPRLVDIDETLCMDPEDLERKIGPNSKLVLVVHMNGAAGHLDRIVDIAHSHGMKVLEDVAQSNGGRFKGKPLGSFGDMAIFSFQINKNMTAGEGGMIVMDDERLYRRAQAAHDWGYPLNENHGMVFDDEDAQVWGAGHRLSELIGAVLVAQESKLDEITTRMRDVTNRLYAELDGVGGAKARPVPDRDGDTGCVMLLTWPDAETCRRMVEATHAAGVHNDAGGGNVRVADWGIHLYYNNVALVNKRPLNSAGRPWSDPLNQFAADYAYGKGTLPQADDLFARSSMLMITPAVTDDAAEEIVAIFKRCAAELGLQSGQAAG